MNGSSPLIPRLGVSASYTYTEGFYISGNWTYVWLLFRDGGWTC